MLHTEHSYQNAAYLGSSENISTNGIDVYELNKTHPLFLNKHFNVQDLNYLDQVKNELINNPTIEWLQKVIAKIPDDNTDLAEVISVVLFSKAAALSEQKNQNSTSQLHKWAVAGELVAVFVQEPNRSDKSVPDLQELFEPFFTTSDFNESDLQYLEQIKAELLLDGSESNFRKIIDTVPETKAHLGHPILQMFARLCFLKQKDKTQQ